jgi:hypothetical protein
MKFIPYNPFRHLEYARQALNVPISAFTRGIVAIGLDTMPCAVVLLDNWTETAVTAHIAVQNNMALRKLHIEAFKYVFLDLNKRMMLGIVPSDNAKALKLHAHLGFTEIARIKDGYDIGVDQVVIQMLRKECRYITDLKHLDSGHTPVMPQVGG